MVRKESCECCLMPFASDPGQRTSDKYCSFCFQDGTLNAEGASLQEFQRCSYQGMRQRGMNPIKARVFAYSVRFAPYWKSRAAGETR